MIRVLVTGAQGQLGRALQKIVHDHTDLLFVFRERHVLDVTEMEQLERELETGYDYCINAAAYTDVDEAERNPDQAFAVNSEGVRNLAQLCAKHETVLIHISTDYVFDGKKKSPYFPSDETNPINIYGRSKLQGEKAVQDLLTKYYIVRTSWLYSETGDNFYTAILSRAKKGESLQVTDQQIGCPTHVDNLAKYLIQIIRTPDKSFGIYHFTDGEAMSWYEFAQRILEQNDLASKVSLSKSENYRTFARRPKNSVLKNTTNEL